MCPGLTEGSPERLRCWLPSWVVLLALAVVSCASWTRPPVPSVPPTSAALDAQLLSALTARQQTITRLRGLARVVYTGPHEKGNARQAIAVETPAHFRLELFSPVGIALLTTCDGRVLAAYVPQEKTLYRGAATAANIARFIRIPLAPHDIANLLLGLPLLPPHGTIRSVQTDPETGEHQLTIASAQQETHTLWFTQQHLWLTRWEARAPAGTLLARVIFADYRKIGHHYFPFEIVLSDAQNRQEASIYYERVELNPSLPDSLFTLGPIPGVQEVEMDGFAGKPSGGRS